MHCTDVERLTALFQDLQLPPAFALPSDEAILRAIESAYERDFSYIPYAPVFEFIAQERAELHQGP